MIRLSGDSKGPIAKYVDTLFMKNWRELKISADLHVKLLDANKREEVVCSYTKEGYLDGQAIVSSRRWSKRRMPCFSYWDST